RVAELDLEDAHGQLLGRPPAGLGPEIAALLRLELDGPDADAAPVRALLALQARVHRGEDVYACSHSLLTAELVDGRDTRVEAPIHNLGLEHYLVWITGLEPEERAGLLAVLLLDAGCILGLELVIRRLVVLVERREASDLPDRPLARLDALLLLELEQMYRVV